MKAYPFQISVHDVICMKIGKALCHIQQLEGNVVSRVLVAEESLTKPTRLVSGFSLM